MRKFNRAPEAAVIMYNHDGDQRWGIYIVERLRKVEILRTVALSVERKAQLPSQVSQWIDPETQKPFHNKANQPYTPKVLFMSFKWC